MNPMDTEFQRVYNDGYRTGFLSGAFFGFASCCILFFLVFALVWRMG